MASCPNLTFRHHFTVRLGHCYILWQWPRRFAVVVVVAAAAAADAADADADAAKAERLPLLRGHTVVIYWPHIRLTQRDLHRALRITNNKHARGAWCRR